MCIQIKIEQQKKGNCIAYTTAHDNWLLQIAHWASVKKQQADERQTDRQSVFNIEWICMCPVCSVTYLYIWPNEPHSFVIPNKILKDTTAIQMWAHILTHSLASVVVAESLAVFLLCVCVCGVSFLATWIYLKFLRIALRKLRATSEWIYWILNTFIYIASRCKVWQLYFTFFYKFLCVCVCACLYTLLFILYELCCMEIH